MGTPKALLPFGDEVLLQRTVRILSDVVAPIVVVAAPDQDLPSLSDSIMIARDDQAYLGPLNGLAAGLVALKGRVQVAYLSSCDVPFLLPPFVRRVIDRLGPASVCLPDVEGFKHPLAAAYRVDVLPVVRDLMAADRLRPVYLAEQLLTQVLGRADLIDVDPNLQSLRNVNTPAEYRAALRDAGYASADPE
jgi:molybdopterin-guanine dinucleotide biosynthesis protein A